MNFWPFFKKFKINFRQINRPKWRKRKRLKNRMINQSMNSVPDCQWRHRTKGATKKYQSLEQAGSRDVTWRLKINHFLLRLAPFIFISFKKQKANGQVKQAASSFPTTAHLHNATEKIHSPQVSGRRTPPKKTFQTHRNRRKQKKTKQIRWFEYMQMRRVTFSDSDVHYTTHDVQHGTEATDGASSRRSAGSTGPPHAICRQFRRSAVSTLFSRPKSKKMKLSRISHQSPSTSFNQSPTGGRRTGKFQIWRQKIKFKFWRHWRVTRPTF